MRRALPLALVLAVVLAVPVTAADYTPRQAAHKLARDYVAPLVRPDAAPVHIHGWPCHPAEGKWLACRVRITGAVVCRLIARVRYQGGDTYTGWVPRMRCR